MPEASWPSLPGKLADAENHVTDHAGNEDIRKEGRCAALIQNHSGGNADAQPDERQKQSLEDDQSRDLPLNAPTGEVSLLRCRSETPMLSAEKMMNVARIETRRRDVSSSRTPARFSSIFVRASLSTEV